MERALLNSQMLDRIVAGDEPGFVFVFAVFRRTECAHFAIRIYKNLHTVSDVTGDIAAVLSDGNKQQRARLIVKRIGVVQHGIGGFDPCTGCDHVGFVFPKIFKAYVQLACDRNGCQFCTDVAVRTASGAVCKCSRGVIITGEYRRFVLTGDVMQTMVRAGHPC